MTLLPVSLRLDLIGAPGSATPPVAAPPAPASQPSTLPEGLAEAIDQISSQLGFTPNQKTALTNTFSRILSGEIILAPYGQGGAPLCVYIDEAGNQHQLLGAGDPLSKLIPAETGLLNGANLDAQLTKYYTEHNLGTATDILQIQAAVIADLAGGNAQLAETLRQRIGMIAAAKLFYANAQNELSLGYFERKEIAGFGTAYELNTTLPPEVAAILQAGPPEDSSVLQRFVRALLRIDGVEGIEEFSLEQIINFYGQKLDAGFFSRIPVTNENAEKIYYQLGLLEVDGDRTYRAYLFDPNAILSAISTGSLNGSSIRGGCLYVESESVITDNPILRAALWLGHITYQARPEYFAGAGDSGKIYMELWTSPGNPNDYNLVQCSYLLNRYLHSESADPGPNLYLNDYLTLKFVEGELGRVNTDSHFIALRNALRTAGVDSIALSQIQAQSEEQEEELELRTNLIDTAPVGALIDNGVEMVVGFETETMWGGEDEETVSVTGMRFEGGPAPAQAVILDWIRQRLTSMGISSDELGYGEQITPRLLTYLINLYNIMLNEAGGNQIQGAGQFMDNLEGRLAQPIENYIWDLSAEGVHTQRILELFLSQGGLLIEGMGIGGPEFADINALQTMVRAMHAMFVSGQIYNFIRVPVRLMEIIEEISTVNIQMEAIKASIDQLAAKAQNGNITQAEIAEYQNLVNEFNAYIEQQRQLVDEHKALLDGWKTTLTNLGVSFTGTEEEQEQKYFELAQKICGLVSQLLDGKELADITAENLAGIQMDVEVIRQILDLVPGITPEELLARIQNSQLNQQEININGEFLKYLMKMAVEGIRPQTVEELINKSLVVETARDLHVFDGLPANKQFMLLLYYFKLVDNDQERFNRLKAFFTLGTPCQDDDLVRFFTVLNRPYDTAKMQEARTLTMALDANSFVIKESSLREAKLLADSGMDHFVVFTPMAEFHPTGHAGYVGNLMYSVQQYNAQDLYNQNQYLGLIILDMQQQGLSTVAVSPSISADTLGSVIDFYALPEGQGITPPSLTQPPAGSIRLPYAHAVSPFARQTFGDLLNFLNGDGLALLTPDSRLQAIIYKAYLACQGGNCMLTFTPEEVEFMRTSGLAQLRALLNGIVKTGDRTLSAEEKDLIYDSLTNIFSEENLYSDIPAISEEDKAALLALKAHLLSGRMGRNYINNDDILFVLGCGSANQAFFVRFGLQDVPSAERNELFNQIKQACEVLRRIAYSSALNMQVRMQEQHGLSWYEEIFKSVEQAVVGTFAPPNTPLQGIGTDVWTVAAAKAVFFPERVERAHLEFMRSQILSAFFNSLYFENGAYHLDHDKLKTALEKLKEKVSADADFCAKIDLILANLGNLISFFASTNHGGLNLALLSFFGATAMGEGEVRALVAEMSASLERYQLDINYLTSERIDYAFMQKLKEQIQVGGFWEEQLHEIVATLFSGFVMVPGEGAPLTYAAAAERVVAFIDSLPENWEGWSNLSISPQAQNNNEMAIKSLVAQFLSMRHPTDLEDGGFSLTAIAEDMASSPGTRLLGLPMEMNGGIYLKYQIVMMGGLQSVEGTAITLTTLSDLSGWNHISAQEFRTYGDLLRKMYENMGPQNILLGLAPNILESLLQADTDLVVAGSEVFSIGGERSVLRSDYHTARQVFLAMYLSGRLEGHFEGSPQDLLHFNELLTAENVNWNQVLAMLGDKVKFVPNGEGSKNNPWDPNFNELSPTDNNYWSRMAAAHPNGVEITTEDTPPGTALSGLYDVLGLSDPEAIAITNRLNTNFTPIAASRGGSTIGTSGVSPTVTVATPHPLNPLLAISPEAGAAWEALDLAISTSNDPEAARSWVRGVFSMFEMLIGPLTNLDPAGGFDKFIERLQEEASLLGIGEGIIQSLIQVITFKFKFGFFMYVSVEFGIPIEVLREMGWDAGSIAGAFLKSLIPLFIFPSFGTVWLTDAVNRWNDGDVIGAILEFWMVNTMACRRHFQNNQLVAISTWDKTFNFFDGLLKGLVALQNGASDFNAYWEECQRTGRALQFRQLFEMIKASFNDLAGPIELLREHQFMQRSAAGSAVAAVGDWGLRWIVEGPMVQFESWMQEKSPLAYNIYEGVFTLGTGPLREYVGTPAEARSQMVYQAQVQQALSSGVTAEVARALGFEGFNPQVREQVAGAILEKLPEYIKLRGQGLSTADIAVQTGMRTGVINLFEKLYELEVQFEVQQLGRSAAGQYAGRVARTIGTYATSPMRLLYIPYQVVSRGWQAWRYPTSLAQVGQMAMQAVYQPALESFVRAQGFDPAQILVQDPARPGQVRFSNPEGNPNLSSVNRNNNFEIGRQEAFANRAMRLFRSKVNAEVARTFGFTEFNAQVRAQVSGAILEAYQQYRVMRSQPGFSLSEFAEGNFWQSQGMDLNVLNIMEQLYQMEVAEFQSGSSTPYVQERARAVQNVARANGVPRSTPAAPAAPAAPAVAPGADPIIPVTDADILGAEEIPAPEPMSDADVTQRWQMPQEGQQPQQMGRPIYPAELQEFLDERASGTFSFDTPAASPMYYIVGDHAFNVQMPHTSAETFMGLSLGEINDFASKLEARGVDYLITEPGMALTAADLQIILDQIPEGAETRRTVVVLKPRGSNLPPIVFNLSTEGLAVSSTEGGFEIKGADGTSIARYKFGWETHGLEIQEVWRNPSTADTADALRAEINTQWETVSQRILSGVDSEYRQHVERMRAFLDSLPLARSARAVEWTASNGLGLLSIFVARGIFSDIQDPSARIGLELLTMHGLSAFATAPVTAYLRTLPRVTPSGLVDPRTTVGREFGESLGRSFGLRGWGGLGWGMLLGMPITMGYDALADAAGFPDWAQSEGAELGVAWVGTTLLSSAIEKIFIWRMGAQAGSAAFASFSAVLGITALAMFAAYLLASWINDDVPDEFKDPQAQVRNIRGRYHDPLRVAQKVYEYQVRYQSWVVNYVHTHELTGLGAAAGFALGGGLDSDGIDQPPDLEFNVTYAASQINTEDLTMFQTAQTNVEDFFKGWLSNQVQADLQSGTITYEDLCDPEALMERYYPQFLDYIDHSWLGLGDINSEAVPGLTREMFTGTYQHIQDNLKQQADQQRERVENGYYPGPDPEVDYEELRTWLKTTYPIFAQDENLLQYFIEKFFTVRNLLGQISILTTKFPQAAGGEANDGHYLQAFNEKGELIDREALRGLVEGVWQPMLQEMQTQGVVRSLWEIDRNPGANNVDLWVGADSPIPHQNPYVPSWDAESSAASGPINFNDPLVIQAMEFIRQEQRPQIIQHMVELILYVLQQLNETGSPLLASNYTKLDIELGLVNTDGSINLNSEYYQEALEMLKQNPQLLDFRVAYLAVHSTQDDQGMRIPTHVSGGAQDFDFILDIYVHADQIDAAGFVSLLPTLSTADALGVRLAYLIQQELESAVAGGPMGLLFGNSSDENVPPEQDYNNGLFVQDPLTSYWSISAVNYGQDSPFDHALAMLRPGWAAERSALEAASPEALKTRILILRMMLAKAMTANDTNSWVILQEYLTALGDDLLWTHDLEYVSKLAGLRDKWFAAQSALNSGEGTFNPEAIVDAVTALSQAAEGDLPYDGSYGKMRQILRANPDAAFKITLDGIDYYIRLRNNQPVLTDEAGLEMFLTTSHPVHELLVLVFGDDNPASSVLYDYLRGLPQNLAEGQVIDLNAVLPAADLVDVDGSM